MYIVIKIKEVQNMIPGVHHPLLDGYRVSRHRIDEHVTFQGVSLMGVLEPKEVIPAHIIGHFLGELSKGASPTLNNLNCLFGQIDGQLDIVL